MKKNYFTEFIHIFLLFTIITQFTFLQIPAFGDDKKPELSAEEESRQAAIGFLNLQYGNHWKSYPTDGDIKKAVDAFPKTVRKDDKFLGKPSYTETVITCSLGQVIKKHSIEYGKINPKESNHLFVKVSFTKTTTYHTRNVATGKMDVTTDTSKGTVYLKLAQDKDGTFTFGNTEGIINDPKPFTDKDGKLAYADGWLPFESNKYKLHGKILDGNGKPMPYVYLLVMVNGKEIRVPVDSAGKYEHSFDLANPMTEEAKKARIRMAFSYTKDSREWFKLVMNPKPSSSPDNILTVIKFDLDTSKKEMVKDISFTTADQGYVSKTNTGKDEVVTNISSVEKLKKISVVYKNYCDSFKFAEEKLKVDFSKNMPLKIEVESAHPTVFDPYNKTIMLQDEHTLNVSSNIWVQHHEFGHYTQYTAYGNRFPDNVAHEGDPRNYPHWGYVNDDTGDSFSEGFANYFPCIVAKYGDSPLKEPDVLGVFGSINDPWSAWTDEGTNEEFAFAAIMWDLSEKVKIPYQEVWDVFKTDRGNFYNYYQEFIKRYKDKKKEIDSVYINHGVYAIKLPGNHKYDYSEPYIDSNGNGQWDSGEYFVDFSIDPKTGNIFMGTTNDMVIGQSSNYERMGKRYSTYRFPNSYLKVNGGPGQSLTVRVKYLDGTYSYSYTAPLYNGKIYMCKLPDSLKAEISVVSPSSNDSGKVYYKTTTTELKEKFKSSRKSDSLDTVTINDTQAKPAGDITEPKDDKKINYLWVILSAVISLMLGILGVSLLNKSKAAAIVLMSVMIVLLSGSAYYVIEGLSNSSGTLSGAPGKQIIPAPSRSSDKPAAPKDTAAVKDADVKTTDTKSADTKNTNAIKTGKLYYESGALKYEGELSGETPNGKGTFYFENGKIQYEGGLLNGKAHGKGIRYDTNGKTIYDGDFSNGSYEGYGKLYYSSGDFYEGYLVNSVPHGLGAYIWANDDRYIGEFKEGQMDGEGIYTKKDGTVYHDGLWSKGKKVAK